MIKKMSSNRTRKCMVTHQRKLARIWTAGLHSLILMKNCADAQKAAPHRPCLLLLEKKRTDDKTQKNHRYISACTSLDSLYVQSSSLGLPSPPFGLREGAAITVGTMPIGTQSVRDFKPELSPSSTSTGAPTTTSSP